MKTTHTTITRRLNVRWDEQNWCPEIVRTVPVNPIPEVRSRTHMKNISSRAASRGFTLIEMLTVIAIIAILAGMLLPVFGKVKLKAQIASSRNSIQGIVAAISQYYTDYSRYPTGPKAPQNLDPVTYPDFTYGTIYNLSGTQEPVLGQSVPPFGTGRPSGFTGYQSPNGEVMAVLLDQEYYRIPPCSTYTPQVAPFPTDNLNHARNPKKKNGYLDARFVDDVNKSGVGPDLVYRDPWGSPYIITLDLNYDGKCRDAIYRNKDVSMLQGSSGFFGLYNTLDPANNPGNNYEYNGPVMVWSLGPDKSASTGATADPKANPKTVNTDNILSWQ